MRSRSSYNHSRACFVLDVSFRKGRCIYSVAVRRFALLRDNQSVTRSILTQIGLLHLKGALNKVCFSSSGVVSSRAPGSSISPDTHQRKLRDRLQSLRSFLRVECVLFLRFVCMSV